jgi:hypothetical protein
MSMTHAPFWQPGQEEQMGTVVIGMNRISGQPRSR